MKWSNMSKKRLPDKFGKPAYFLCFTHIIDNCCRINYQSICLKQSLPSLICIKRFRKILLSLRWHNAISIRHIDMPKKHEIWHMDKTTTTIFFENPCHFQDAFFWMRKMFKTTNTGNIIKSICSKGKLLAIFDKKRSIDVLFGK